MPGTVSKTYKFEALLYNRVVRDLVDEDKHHRYLYDAWAENHYVGIEAEDVDRARAKLERLYPADIGFVIGEIVGVPDEE